MLKKFDRYVFVDLVKPFISGVFASVVILVANAFFLYLKLMKDTNLPWETAMSLFAFQIPGWIVLAFPMGYLFSSLIVVGRLSKDHELTALQSCGVSLFRTSIPVLTMSVLISALAFTISEGIVPSANYQSKMIYIDIATNPKLLPIKEKLFFDTKENQKYMYIDVVNKDTGLLKNIFIFDSKSELFPKVITAKKGLRRGDKIVLNDGNLKKYSKTGNVVYEASFKEMQIIMDLSRTLTFDTQKDTNDLSYFQSEAMLKTLEQKLAGNPDKIKIINEKRVFHYTKISLPLATFFVTLVSIPIGMLFVKRSIFIGLAICIALIFAWQVLFTLSSSLGKVGSIEPLLASWIPNLLFVVLGVPMLIYLSKK